MTELGDFDRYSADGRRLPPGRLFAGLLDGVIGNQARVIDPHMVAYVGDTSVAKGTEVQHGIIDPDTLEQTTEETKYLEEEV